MKLQNGCYYKRQDASVVKVQLERDGLFHCYTSDGLAVGRVDPDKHVEGWAPVGVADFDKTKEKSKSSDKKAVKKKAEKKAD